MLCLYAAGGVELRGSSRGEKMFVKADLRSVKANGKRGTRGAGVCLAAGREIIDYT